MLVEFFKAWKIVMQAKIDIEALKLPNGSSKPITEELDSILDYTIPQQELRYIAEKTNDIS